MPSSISAELRSQGREDKAQRTLSLTGAPIFEMPPTYQRDRRFRPTEMRLSWVDTKLIYVRISGPVIRGDGSQGTRTQGMTWDVRGETPPAWVGDIAEMFGNVPTWDEVGKSVAGGRP
jgi:hypothetical protein